ncbi:hypothetical protein TEA_010521 [Camellia sinensis var. sinensis]|uniref:Lipoxygenase n=1 Tax=Camellia sinensis var. sinensis TaxID=542762 RepID=A0A4S4EI95_CAMSN|nr:hypothetical protein TEA_010521 [Camellia sinensis var. sinensis]
MEETGLEKETIKGYAHRKSQEKDEVKYECNFVIPEGYGEIGAVLVENEHHKEMYLKNIVFHGFPPGGPVDVTCNSWVASKFDSPHKRIFFTNKSYLPSQTPDGLKRLREEDLENLRGNGQGERKTYERIYDYDVYNDIGDPDSSPTSKRPVLGDPMSESRSSTVYVPRDEAFSDVKELTFSAKAVYSVLHALVPSLETAIDLLPRLVKFVTDAEEGLLRFETPALFERDKFSWFRDEEFSRQTLAGLNPYSIQLVKEWPLKSKLDPKIYGPPESAITKELIEREIRGFMTLEVALQKKKLFMLDYHDLLLPYVNKVRESKGTTLYGSRTIFFLTPDGTLMPLAIELTRPPVDGKPQWKQVFTPTWDATGCWLWRLAKAHALAHDSGYHQLVSHWLTTHCVTEPYIIASNRQLSAMHPIYRLLHPHFRYTMEINALAREALINAGGIIETCFSPGKYSIELSSVAYDQLWRFDLQALPADLISSQFTIDTVGLAVVQLFFAIDDQKFDDCITQFSISIQGVCTDQIDRVLE